MSSSQEIPESKGDSWPPFIFRGQYWSTSIVSKLFCSFIVQCRNILLRSSETLNTNNFSHLWLYFSLLLKMVAFSCEEWQIITNVCSRASPVLLENISYYFLLRYLIVDAETMLCCAEYNHRIRWNSTGTYVNITIVLWIVTSRACFPLQMHIRCINSVRCNYTRSIYRTFPAPTDAITTDVVTFLITSLSSAFYSVRVPLVHLSSVFCGLTRCPT